MKALHTAAAATASPEKEIEVKASKASISYEQFAAMDMRTGVILEATKVPKADRLLQLLVDIGHEKRTIVSGIAEHFKPEELIGQHVVVLINLAPRKMKGVESQGMILMAEDADGKLYFLSAANSPLSGLPIS